MIWNKIKGKGKQYTDIVKRRWEKLSDHEFEFIERNKHISFNKLHQKNQQITNEEMQKYLTYYETRMKEKNHTR